MHLVVATTAHLATDVRVRRKVVDSLLERGWGITWIGPASPANPSGSEPPNDAIDFRRLPAVTGRLSRLATPRRLRRALVSIEQAADWIYCPDPDAVAAARAFRTHTGTRVWFDIHERYHNDHARAWLGPLDSTRSRDLVRRWVASGARQSDLVTSPSPAVLRDYAESHENAHLLLNAARQDFARGTAPASRSTGDRMQIMHGKPGKNRGTLELAAALDILDMLGRDVTVICLGDIGDLASAIGVKRAEALTSTDRCARFAILEQVSHDQMPALTSQCHLGVVGYTGSLAPASYPNRLFEFMAAGIPVLGPVESPFIADTIDDYGCGLTYTNADVASLAVAIDRLHGDPNHARSMGGRGRAAFLAHFTWEAQLERILALLEEPPRSATRTNQ